MGDPQRSLPSKILWVQVLLLLYVNAGLLSPFLHEQLFDGAVTSAVPSKAIKLLIPSSPVFSFTAGSH